MSVKLCYLKISLALQLFQSVSMYPFLWGYCGPNDSFHWQLDWFLKLTKCAHCLVLQLRFYYHMYSLWGRKTMGTLRVLLRNTVTGTKSSIWEQSGNQGNQWIRANVPINTSWRVTQVPQGFYTQMFLYAFEWGAFVLHIREPLAPMTTTATKTPRV